MVAKRGVSMGTQVNQSPPRNGLASVATEYHQRRQNDTAWQANRIPYIANYYGHKLHIDHNEKLVIYVCCHTCLCY